jgi:hypothetical protein
VVEDDTNPDSSPFVVEATGDVLIGTATSIVGAFSDTGKLQVATNTGEATQHNYAFLSNPNGSIIYLNKSRSGTIGANTIVQNADILGQLVFAGADGSSYTRGAAIIAEVDGTPGTNDMPGRLVFSTTADGASSPTERMRINNAGSVGIGTSLLNNRFQVQGGGTTLSRASSNIIAPPAVELLLFTTVNTSNIGTPQLVFASDRTDRYSSIGHYRGATSSTIGMSFFVDNLAGTQVEVMRMDAASQSISNVASGTGTNAYGFSVSSNLTGATNNYGFYSNIATGTNRYNFFAAGTADNFFGGPVTVSTSSTSDALRVTQTGTGNALVVEDSANPDSSPFVITADGTMVLGYTTSVNSLGYAQGAQFYRQSGTIGQFRYSTDTGASELVSSKSRGTQASPTIVVNGDGLWLGRFAGYDGANFIEAARFSVEVDGTPGANDMPGRLMFSTTADGASSPTERMRIDNAGNIYGTTGTTTMTSGFFHIPAAAGAPTGVPTAIAGRVPMYYDTTNNNFYVYNGAWKKVLLA